MKQFRKIIFWLHLSAGVTCGLIIFTMCVTGALLTFERQILQFAEREFRLVKPDSTHLSVDTLLEKCRKFKPAVSFTGITLQADPSASAMITTKPDGVLYIDPYSGQILGEGSKSWREFFREMTDLHRWLAAEGENRAAVRSITGFCNAAFLVLAISGVYLWLPKKWIKQNLRTITWFQRGLKSRARDFNWHNVIGFWCSTILIVITITALVISYEWANNLLYTLTASEKPSGVRAVAGRDSKINIPKNLELLKTRTIEQVPNWKSMNIRFQTGKSSSIPISITDGSSQNPFVRSQLTLNSNDGSVIRWEPYTQLNPGRKLRIWFRSLHTGEGVGIFGQIIAFVATVGGAFLVYTGLMLVTRRFAKWVTKTSKKNGLKDAA
jgi:uncharacterized iron-regulated membrane protein